MKTFILNIMNRIFTRALLIICVLHITSCTKEKLSNNPVYKDYATSLMELLLLGKDDADLNIRVSASHGVGLFQANPLEESRVYISGSNVERKMLGELSVSNTNIPFNGYYYSLGTMTVLDYSTFLGRNIDIVFAGNYLFPSFQTNYYSPSVTNLTYTGLVDNKLPTDASLTISWEPDSLYVSNKALVIIEGDHLDDRKNPEYRTTYKEVNDKDASVVFNQEELQAFLKYKSIQIYFAKGYSVKENIDGRNVKFNFINFSCSRIYIAK